MCLKSILFHTNNPTLDHAEVYILQMEQVYFPKFFFRSRDNGNLKNSNS